MYSSNTDFITMINSMIGLGNGMARSENFIVDYREVIVSHKQLIRRVIPLVTMRKIAIALLVDIAVARYEQIGPGTKDRSYAVMCNID